MRRSFSSSRNSRKMNYAVTRQHGLRTEAGAMVTAIAVEQLVHLG